MSRYDTRRDRESAFYAMVLGFVVFWSEILCCRLVVLGNSLTALAVVRDAADAGLDPVLADNQFDVAQKTRRAEVLPVEGAADAEILERIVHLAKQKDSCLIATSDRWLKFVIQHREILDRYFQMVLHSKNATLSLCVDKVQFLRWCKIHDIPTPSFWLPNTEERSGDISLPMILRPARTRHNLPSRVIPKAIEVKTQEELNRWLEVFRLYQVEPLISQSLLGRCLEQVSVPVVRNQNGTMIFVARKVRPLPDRCSVGSLVELWPHQGIESMARRLIDELDFTGMGEIEILFDSQTGEYWVVEFNPRPWLQYALAPASGYDFINFCMNRPIRQLGPQMRRGRVWIEFRSDLFHAFSRQIGSVRRGEQSFFDYVKSIAKANVPARFSWRDLHASF